MVQQARQQVVIGTGEHNTKTVDPSTGDNSELNLISLDAANTPDLFFFDP